MTVFSDAALLPDALPDTDEWEKIYGFPHDCHCREDWDTGNVVEVSECYFRMSIDALNTLEAMKKKLDGKLL